MHVTKGGACMSMKSYWARPRIQEASPLARFLERQREHRGLTKIELAERMSLSRRTYQNWLEDPSVLTVERLELLAGALEMTEQSRAVLYELSGRAIPAPAGHRSMSTEGLQVHRQMINGISHPTLIHTRYWDVLLTNQAFREIFASVPPCGRAVPSRNPMLYIVCHPAAHELLGGTQEAFHDHWLMPALAAFSAVQQQTPNDPRILGIEEEISRRPRILRAYSSTADWISQHNDLHVNSAMRPFVHPELGLIEVQILNEAHLGYEGLDWLRSTWLLRGEKGQD